MTYSEKLKNPKWQKKRLEILQRDEFKCQLCKDAETELHVHHLKYTKNPWDAPNEYLQTLCKDCHHFIEFLKRSKYWELEYLTGIIKTENGIIMVLTDDFVNYFIDKYSYTLLEMFSISDINKINEYLNGRG